MMDENQLITSSRRKQSTVDPGQFRGSAQSVARGTPGCVDGELTGSRTHAHSCLPLGPLFSPQEAVGG